MDNKIIKIKKKQLSKESILLSGENIQKVNGNSNM